MKELTYTRLFTLVFLVVVLTSCEKDFNISDPEIYIENRYPAVGESLIIKIREYAESGGIRESPDSYKWVIKNSKGKVIKDDFYSNSLITYTPEEEGTIEIIVKLGYRGLRSVSASIEVYINKLDYRYVYSGDYHFMKVTDHWTENTGHNRDTTFYDGFVNPDDSDKNSVIIKIGEGNLGNSGWSEYFKAKLEYP